VKTEYRQTLEVLQIALEVERDGRECYLQAVDSSSTEAGKKLLLALADDEEAHRLKVEEIYNAIRTRQTWPTGDLPADRRGNLRLLLAQTCRALGVDAKPITTEVDVLKMAIEKESKSLDFYEKQSEHAVYDGEQEFYKALAAQEKEHHFILLDYYELLADPAGWFLRKEHQSLDGG
jgi:rubrerythrin